MRAPLHVVGYGAEARLVELADADAVRTLDRALSSPLPPGVLDVVPAARSVLVVFDGAATTAGAVDAWLARAWLDAEPGRDADAAVVELRVRYDGVDLAAVAAHAQLTPAEVVARHTAADLRVAFCGFAPGFAYLEGLDLGVEIPRLASPRLTVPAGAVAVAARYTAVYPRPSPGGWLVIGTCLDPVWDAAAEPPARLTPGRRVRFVAV